MASCSCHIAVGIVAGDVKLVPFDFLVDVISKYSIQMSNSMGPPGKADKLMVFRGFESFNHCPKCGSRLDLAKVKRELGLVKARE